MERYIFNDMVTMYQIWNSFEEYEVVVLNFAKRFGCSNDTAANYVQMVKSNIEENESRKLFVTSFMHSSGENFNKLNEKQRWQIFCQADGFGHRYPDDLKQFGLDWGHVRDSSIDGWKRMEKKLKSFGFQ